MKESLLEHYDLFCCGQYLDFLVIFTNIVFVLITLRNCLLDFEVFLSENVHKFFNLISKRVRLNYTTTHHQPKYIYHHPPPAKTYLPPHTTTQKMDHSIKAKICSFITSFRHCFNTFFFNEMQYSLRDGGFV